MMRTNLNITCAQKGKQRSARIPAALTKETAFAVPRARELGLVTGPPSKGPPSMGPERCLASFTQHYAWKIRLCRCTESSFAVSHHCRICTATRWFLCSLDGCWTTGFLPMWGSCKQCCFGRSSSCSLVKIFTHFL